MAQVLNLIALNLGEILAIHVCILVNVLEQYRVALVWTDICIESNDFC